MSSLNLAKAKKNNAIFANVTKPAWKTRFYQVAEKLGIYHQTPTADAFAQAVYQWQLSQPGMTADGILGPKSWAKLEPRTRYSINFGAPTPDWISEMPPGWKPDAPATPPAPAKNGVTDYLDEEIAKDPSYATTLVNSGVFTSSFGLGKLNQLGKLGKFAAGAIVQPLVWAVQGNTGDAGDKFLYAMGLVPLLTVPAGLVGIWKGLMDDDVLDKLAQITKGEPPELAKFIFPAATYSWKAYGPLLAKKIAADGGVAWQHPNGLWVFLKFERHGKTILSCDYRPKIAKTIVGPELPLRITGTKFNWRYHKGI